MLQYPRPVRAGLGGAKRTRSADANCAGCQAGGGGAWSAEARKPGSSLENPMKPQEGVEIPVWSWSPTGPLFSTVGQGVMFSSQINTFKI